MMERFTNICEATSQSHDFEDFRPTHRKGKKLLAEKKRRARINNCLMQIKNIVCEGEEEKDTDLDKMEKAEILERTLEVLTRLRTEHNTSHRDPFSARKAMAVRYASGFSSCAEESIRYIQNSRLVPSEVKVQLQTHLRTIARRMETVVQVPNPLPSPMPYPSSHSITNPAHSDSRSCIVPSPIHTSTPQLQVITTVTTSTPSSQVYERLPKPDSSFANSDCSTHLLTPFVSKPCTIASPDQKENVNAVSVNQDLRYVQSSEASAFRRVDTCSTDVTSEPSDSFTVESPSSSSTSYLPPVVPVTPPTHQEQPMYRYVGYEPYPVLATAYVGQPRPMSAGEPVMVSVTKALAPAVTTSALDLCLKPYTTHQISPETMWRPW